MTSFTRNNSANSRDWWLIQRTHGQPLGPWHAREKSNWSSVWTINIKKTEKVRNSVAWSDMGRMVVTAYIGSFWTPSIHFFNNERYQIFFGFNEAKIVNLLMWCRYFGVWLRLGYEYLIKLTWTFKLIEHKINMPYVPYTSWTSPLTLDA